jgi:hypothetical protein
VTSLYGSNVRKYNVTKVFFGTFASWLHRFRKPYVAKSIFETRGVKLFSLEDQHGKCEEMMSIQF